MTVRFTAAAVCLVIGAALMPPAHAQDRDLKTWGGPPNLGIDFKTGNSYGVSDFGAANPAAEPKRRVTRSRGGRKSNPTETARGTLKNPPLPQPNPARLAADPSSTRTAATSAGTATDASPVETGTLAEPLNLGPIPCRKYDPTTGRTIEVGVGRLIDASEWFIHRRCAARSDCASIVARSRATNRAAYSSSDGSAKIVAARTFQLALTLRRHHG